MRNKNNFLLSLLFITIITLTTSAKIFAQNTLVLIHDTTVTSSLQKRLADRDSMFRYLPSLISGYTVQTFDTTSTLSNLIGSSYQTIIIQETSFDAINARYMGLTARNNLMNWLASGTAGNKKALILIGGDIAYNYARTGSGSKDSVFSLEICKFGYRVDNGSITNFYSITGAAIDSGNVREMTNSPAGSGYYPDGAINNGGVTLYKYTNRISNTDTLAAIGYSGTNYVVASLFQDPRYFINGHLRFVLSNIINWVRTNGGTITNAGYFAVNNPVKFELSQNYPNPFNPVTKINFSIPKSGNVTLRVYDILGKEVATLVNEYRNAGNYSVDFNGTQLSSGIYTYRLESGLRTETKMMTLVK